MEQELEKKTTKRQEEEQVQNLKDKISSEKVSNEGVHLKVNELINECLKQLVVLIQIRNESKDEAVGSI